MPKIVQVLEAAAQIAAAFIAGCVLVTAFVFLLAFVVLP